ncbi:hypothetical protein LPB140_06175 [Sphingorhabdus lutea]|uniref:2'-5' RNA ligase family protein n=2 Tax=Sphingorhabdus lutea TaxID=1913578 RepID=A0A1L3JBD4_9SPHN|nr:hypothetical protein LPB140_06175 [Sphingorhabdus lutea]
MNDELCPIILTAQFDAKNQAWANKLRQTHFPAERNYLDAHLTLFHHLPPHHQAEIFAMCKNLCAQYAPLNAQIDRLIHLGRGVAYHVDCPALVHLRQEMAHAFHGLLTQQDQHKPRLHITIQNKVIPAEAKNLLENLQADFTPRDMTITGFAAHAYKGGPWELLKKWQFRGQIRAG